MNALIQRSFIGVAVFFVAFVVNPLYFAGCVAADPEPNFGEAEMVAILGTVRSTDVWTFADNGQNYELTLTLDRATHATRFVPRKDAFSATAMACGTRSFYQTAAACITVTRLPLTGSFMLERVNGAERTTVAASVSFEGALEVYGDTIGSARLDLTFRDGIDGISIGSPDAHEFTLERIHAQDLGEEALDLDFTAP